MINGKMTRFEAPEGYVYDYKEPKYIMSLPKMVQGMEITKENEFIFNYIRHFWKCHFIFITAALK